MSILKKICRLCLQKCENFEAIDENTKILLPKIDFTAIQEPVMCKNCAEKVIKCFDFKIKCLRTHNYIVPFINKDNTVLDLRDVYLRKNKTSTSIPEDEAICGLCMDLVEDCAVVTLNVEEKDVMLWKMIEQYLPELDLSIVKKAVICPSCCGSLEDCFRFVTTCLLVEEEIKKYRGTLCSSSKHQHELNSLSQFAEMYVPTSEVDGNSVGIIKVEKEFCEDRKGANMDVQNENESFVGSGDQKVKDEQQFTPNMCTCEEENNKRVPIKIEEMFCEENEPRHAKENLAEIEDQKFLVAEEIEIKTDTHDFNSFPDPLTQSLSVMENMKICSPKDYEISDHVLSVVRMKNINNLAEIKLSEVTCHMCEICFFVTRQEQKFNSHMLSHRKVLHRCESCSYVARRKYDLKRHMLIHQELSEVTVYTYASCSFTTKHKVSLKSHMLTHQELAVEKYKCQICSFATKYKRSLKSHMLTHQELSEVTAYACESCSFITKHKGNMKSHMLTHRELSELTVYRCESCSYVTKRKRNLKSHMLTHHNN